MNSATFDKSRALRLYARTGEAGVTKVLTFLDDDGLAYSISSLDFELEVFKSAPNPFDVDPIFTLAIGTGLTVQGAGNNELAIALTETNAEQKPDTYFWRLKSTDEDHTWLNGPFIFHNGEFDGVSETDEIIVSENGEEITITISSETTNGPQLFSSAVANPTYTILSTDHKKIIPVTVACTITIPPGLDDGFETEVFNESSGTVSFSAGAGVTIRSEGTDLETQYTGASLVHKGLNVWYIVGKLT